MDVARLTLRRADDARLGYVRTLLERNGLPSADVGSTPARFYVGYRVDETNGANDRDEAEDGGDPVGVGGIELHGSAGLLRSVVVERSARGEGVGTALCDALERRAADEGAGALYLLTTTAADFFAGRGYAEIERSGAPPAIRETTEFAELCPETAIPMRKSL
jgi:amino-acid N-acetyltransferase